MVSNKANPLVLSYFERVSWRVLDKYRPIIKLLIKGHAGVYSLYKGERLYYVGLANNLMSRVNHHLKDRHKGKWDRFSVYLTINDAHIRSLEALMLRVVSPEGNKVKGRLSGANDLVRSLARKMSEYQRDETASFLGGRFFTNRRRSKARAAKGSLVLARLVEKPMRLTATHKGIDYKASLRRDGQISYKGKLYASPSSVAKIIVKRPANGWHFWWFRNSRGEWVRLKEIRK